MRCGRCCRKSARSIRICHNEPGFITRWTGLDVLYDSEAWTSASAGPSGAIRAPAAGELVGAALGHRAVARACRCPANQQFATINLVAPGEVWGDRVNEVDIRVGKILRFGRTRTNVGFDMYNVFNSAAILTYNQAFVPGGTWLAPLSVLTPRFVKIGAQISF